MSTFKMGLKNLFVFTALLLLWKVCRVYGQATRVEYISQPCTSSVATTVQATPQLVVPAIYTPAVSPYDSYIQESVPNVPSYNGFNGYANYAPSYSQPMPPIIIEDGNNDNWQNILFLLFAMRNKRNCGSGNFGGCSGGCNSGCGCGGGCNGGCGCGGYYGGNSGGGYDNSGCCCCGNCCCCPYTPYPIPYPMTGAYPYSSGFGGYSDNSCSCLEDTYQPGKGNNDFTLYIKTDSSCCC